VRYYVFKAKEVKLMKKELENELKIEPRDFTMEEGRDRSIVPVEPQNPVVATGPDDGDMLG
jgi:hypothetical protein